MKRLLPTFLAFIFSCGFVGIALGNPIPWDPVDFLFHMNPIQYFSIVVAQFCALTVGTAILTHASPQARWQKTVVIMLIAITTSYLLGIVIWILAFRTGTLTYDSSPLSLTILFLPEVLGTLLGALIIRKLQKTKWRTAFIAMAVAMVTSFLISVLLATIAYLP